MNKSDNVLVIEIVNSTFGKIGQIAYRTQFITKKLEERDIPYFVLARDSIIKKKWLIKVLPFGDLIPRLLNGYRIKINPKFNHRKIDMKIFDYFALKKMKCIIKKNSDKNIIIHLWEFAPNVIDFCNENDIIYIMDVPIAPSHESFKLFEEGISMDTPITEIDKVEDYSIKSTKNFLCPSEYVAEVIGGIVEPSAQINIVNFGTSIKNFRRNYNSSNRKLKFLFVGNVSKRKGVNILIESWIQSEMYKNGELILCGRVNKSIEKRIKDLNTDYSISIMGFVEPEKFYKIADIFIFPTLMEGSAKVIYEAMSYGLPVITTANAGSIIEDGKDGIIIPINNSEEIENAMRYFVENIEQIEKMGKSAHKKVEQYTWDRYAQLVVNLYGYYLGGEH